jgi:N-acetylglucosaminyl-diphospho-decaprenol L-rhamnosyltransferase
MDLSIVILQTNKPKDATNCLAALQHARLPAQTEILMINNGGHDANEQIDPASYAGLPIRFIELPRDGYVFGNNAGYKESKGAYIATVNADITVKPDTIEKILAHMKAHPECGIAAPRLFYPDGTEQDSARPFPSLLELIWRRLINPNAHKHTRTTFSKEYEEVDWITGAMLIMTRKCLEVTGGHDPRYFLFMSDITMSREAWKAGLGTHQLRDASAIHNEARLSRGGLLQLLKKRTGRAHIKDALSYFLKYSGRPKPKLSPSGRH